MAFAPQSLFECNYKVQLMNTWKASTDSKKLFESQHRIILPQNAYQMLQNNECFQPFNFVITNRDHPLHKTYVGSFAFSADIDPSHVILPNHIHKSLEFPSSIHIKYVSLPLAKSIELYPNKSTFIEQAQHKRFIRDELRNFGCIAPSDTLHITINEEAHILTVINIAPNSADAVSLTDREYEVDIKILDADSDDYDDEGRPLISNINTTQGGEIHTICGSDTEEEDDDMFDDDDDGGWNDDDIDSIASDGQDIIPISPIKINRYPNKSMDDDDDDDHLVPDIHSTDDGNSRQLRPVRTKAQHRAWICEYCHSINNLLESMKRQYKCVSCEGRYRPTQTLIESQKEDKPLEEKQQYKVWYCECSKLNLITWTKCDICRADQPKEGIVSFWSTEQPIKTWKDPPQNINMPIADPAAGRDEQSVFNIDKRWRCPKCSRLNCNSYKKCNNCDKRQEYHGNLNLLGDIVSAECYPPKSAKLKMNPRLLKVFGAPYRNSCIVANPYEVGQCAIKNQWKLDNKVGHCMMKMNKDKFAHEIDEKLDFNSVGNRCIALNEETGCIAFAISLQLFALEPSGGCGFMLCAHGVTKLINMTNARVRYVGDEIYVFDPDEYKIYVYFVDKKQGTITLLQEIYESYFMDARIVDIVVTKQLLIVLFDRWMGIYTMYPKLEWYHAVSFSKNKRNKVDSIEMCVHDPYENKEEKATLSLKNILSQTFSNKEEKDAINKRSIQFYAFINCEHHIIAVHPVNPTFDFLHIASNVKNGSSFCNSLKYGTFYINNEQDVIWQSSSYHLASRKANKICSLEEDFEWKQFIKKFIPMDCSHVTESKAIIKDICAFETVLYDETFGISGRLLVRCLMKQRNDLVFYQCFNCDELSHLAEEIERSDYCLNPGSDRKPFNLVVFVYEMLYGTDIIDQYVELAQFNDDEEEEKDIEMKPEIEDKSGKIGSKCLICIDSQKGRWYSGIVVREFVNNDDEEKEYVEISYGKNDDEGMFYAKCLWKYDECIEYKNDDDDDVACSFDIDEECLYYVKHFMCWLPAKVHKIVDDDDSPFDYIIRYVFYNEKNELLFAQDDSAFATNLYKLKNQKKIINVAKMNDFGTEKAIPGIGENADDDDDDDDDENMEIEEEEEGVLIVD